MVGKILCPGCCKCATQEPTPGGPPGLFFRAPLNKLKGGDERDEISRLPSLVWPAHKRAPCERTCARRQCVVFAPSPPLPSPCSSGYYYIIIALANSNEKSVVVVAVVVVGQLCEVARRAGPIKAGRRKTMKKICQCPSKCDAYRYQARPGSWQLSSSLQANWQTARRLAGLAGLAGLPACVRPSLSAGTLESGSRAQHSGLTGPVSSSRTRSSDSLWSSSWS